MEVSSKRNEIIEEITKRGVAVNVHFIPMPMLTVFRNMGFKIENFPISYSLYANEISLPLYPQLTNEQCNFVINAVTESVTVVLKND